MVTELCLDCVRLRRCQFPGCDLQYRFPRCYHWGQLGEGQTESLGVISYGCMQIYNDLQIKSSTEKKSTKLLVLFSGSLSWHLPVCSGGRVPILFLCPRNHVSSPERVANDSSKYGKGACTSATRVGRSTDISLAGFRACKWPKLATGVLMNYNMTCHGRLHEQKIRG